MHPERLELAEDFATAASSQRGKRQQYAIYIAVLDQGRQVLRGVHLDTVDRAAVQGSIVVDEHQRIEGSRSRQHRGQPRAGLARPIDRNAGHRRLDRPGQQIVAHHETRARHVEQRQARVDRHRTPGQGGDFQRESQRPQQHAAQGDGKRDGKHRLVSEKADHRTV